MEWVFFFGGAVAVFVIKAAISYLSLFMKDEWKRREIVRLNKVIDMYRARNERLEHMWLEAETKAETAAGEWPEFIG